MTTDEIEALFQEQINIKGIHKRLEIDKFRMSNYRNKPLSLASKIEVLLKLGAITIQKAK